MDDKIEASTETEPCVIPEEFDLEDVIGAYKDKSISKTELMWVLVENVDHNGLVEILVSEFGVKFARKLMIETLRIAKKQNRERRLNENRRDP